MYSRYNVIFFDYVVRAATGKKPLKFFPFAISGDDRLLLQNPDERARLRKIFSLTDIPVFVFNWRTQASSPAEFSESDSDDPDLLKLALLFYEIRIRVKEGTVAEQYLWFSSEETREHIERIDGHIGVINALLNGSLYISPLKRLKDFLKTENGVDSNMYDYVRLGDQLIKPEKNP